MYLQAKLYVSKYSNPEALAALEKVEMPGVTVPPEYIPNFSSRTMIVPLMYWRKSNQIHAWFVREVQEGVDQCQTAYVDPDKLRELRALCRTVLDARNGDDGEAVAQRLLPTQAGFFFGGTGYDEYYYSDLQETVQALDRLLADYDAGLLKGWEIEYHSSW